LPSVIAAGLVLGIVAVAIGRFIGPRRALWTALVLATSLMAIGLVSTALPASAYVDELGPDLAISASKSLPL